MSATAGPPGEEIRACKNPFDVVHGTLSEDKAGLLVLSLGISGLTYAYTLTFLASGAANRVYTVGQIPDVLIRIAIAKDKFTPDERLAAHEAELHAGVRMAELSVCPRIFMNLRITRVGPVGPVRKPDEYCE